MKLTLLVSLKTQKDNEDPWTLTHAMRGMEQNGQISFSENDGVIPTGSHSVLFDQTKAHGIYVQVCAHLIDKNWPYFVLTVDADAILVEGMSVPKLQAILGKS